MAEKEYLDKEGLEYYHNSIKEKFVQTDSFGFTLNLPETEHQTIEIDQPQFAFQKVEDSPNQYSGVTNFTAMVIPEWEDASLGLPSYSEGVLSCQDEDVIVERLNSSNSSGKCDLNHYVINAPLFKTINLSISAPQKLDFCDFTTNPLYNTTLTAYPSGQVWIFFPEGTVVNGRNYNPGFTFTGSYQTSKQVKNSIFSAAFSMHDNPCLCWKDGVENQTKGYKEINFLIDGETPFNILDYIHYNSVKITEIEFRDNVTRQKVEGEHTVCVESAYTGEVYAKDTITDGVLRQTILVPSIVFHKNDGTSLSGSGDGVYSNSILFYCEDDEIFGGRGTNIYVWTVESTQGTTSSGINPGTIYKNGDFNSDPIYECKLMVYLYRKS